MHRSRLSVLVIFAAAAACSRQDAPADDAILAQDRALVARLEVDQETQRQPLPAACGTVALAAQPALANQQQARDLTRKARDAEMQGNVKEARALLLRASELDGTDKSTAYHLGRTSEALGDRDAAISAYCRYLALTPTTPEAVEAHQRLTKLAPPVTRVAAGAVVDSTPSVRSAPLAKVEAPVPARRAAREHQTSAPRVVASAPAERSAPVVRRDRDTSPVTAPASGADIAAASEPVTRPSEPEGTASSGSTTTAGDVVATAGVEQASAPQPSVEQPSTAPRTARRGPSRAQSAGIGAATGAIIGAATGRSVKSAVIGAAAGGLLGTMVGPRMTPIGRGIAP